MYILEHAATIYEFLNNTLLCKKYHAWGGAEENMRTKIGVGPKKNRCHWTTNVRSKMSNYKKVRKPRCFGDKKYRTQYISRDVLNVKNKLIYRFT